MTTTTSYRIDFTEFIGGNTGRPVRQSALVVGTVDAVQDYLDEFSWDVDSVVVTEFVGSDAAGRQVSQSEWFQG